MTPSEAMLGSSHAENSVDEEPVAAQLCFFCILLVLSFTCAHLAKKSCLSKWLPESLVVLLVGLGASLVLNVLEVLGHKSAVAKYNVAWSSFTFFFALLPPIVFSAAYHAKRDIFFRNAAPIGLLAILGTLISNVVVTAGLFWAVELGLLGHDVHLSLMELVAFGALISSTDPVATLSVFSSLRVDPTLFYTVMGESILNDAIAITAFRSATKYIAQELTQRHEMGFLLAGFLLDFSITFVGSMVLGYGLGIVSALCFKKMDFHNHEHIATIGLMVSFVLLPYYCAESIGLSGIVSTLFSGISARRYTKKNISLSAHLGSSFLFQLLASIAEMSCFLLVGLNIVSVAALSSLHGRLIACTLVLCLVGRAMAVYPLLSALNLVRFLRGATHEPPTFHTTTTTTCTTNVSAISIRVAHNPGLSIRPPGLASLSDESATLTLAPSLGNTFVPMRTMHAIFLSGLRGVVAFACAANFSNANGNLNLVVATTSVTILCTLICFGSTAEFWCSVLKIPTGIDASLFLHKLRASERLFRSTSTGESSRSTKEGFEERYLYPCVLSAKAKRRITESKVHSQFPFEEMDTSGGGSYRAPHDHTDPGSMTSGAAMSPERPFTSEGSPAPSSSRHALVPSLQQQSQQQQSQQQQPQHSATSLLRGVEDFRELFRQISAQSVSGLSPYLVDRRESDEEGPDVEADGVI